MNNSFTSEFSRQFTRVEIEKYVENESTYPSLGLRRLVKRNRETGELKLKRWVEYKLENLLKLLCNEFGQDKVVDSFSSLMEIARNQRDKEVLLLLSQKINSLIDSSQASNFPSQNYPSSSKKEKPPKKINSSLVVKTMILLFALIGRPSLKDIKSAVQHAKNNLKEYPAWVDVNTALNNEDYKTTIELLPEAIEALVENDKEVEWQPSILPERVFREDGVLDLEVETREFTNGMQLQTLLVPAVENGTPIPQEWLNIGAPEGKVASISEYPVGSVTAKIISHDQLQNGTLSPEEIDSIVGYFRIADPYDPVMSILPDGAKIGENVGSKFSESLKMPWLQFISVENEIPQLSVGGTKQAEQFIDNENVFPMYWPVPITEESVNLLQASSVYGSDYFFQAMLSQQNYRASVGINSEYLSQIRDKWYSAVAVDESGNIFIIKVAQGSLLDQNFWFQMTHFLREQGIVAWSFNDIGLDDFSPTLEEFAGDPVSIKRIPDGVFSDEDTAILQEQGLKPSMLPKMNAFGFYLVLMANAPLQVESTTSKPFEVTTTQPSENAANRISRELQETEGYQHLSEEQNELEVYDPIQNTTLESLLVRQFGIRTEDLTNIRFIPPHNSQDNSLFIVKPTLGVNGESAYLIIGSITFRHSMNPELLNSNMYDLEVKLGKSGLISAIIQPDGTYQTSTPFAFSIEEMKKEVEETKASYVQSSLDLDIVRSQEEYFIHADNASFNTAYHFLHSPETLNFLRHELKQEFVDTEIKIFPVINRYDSQYSSETYYILIPKSGELAPSPRLSELENYALLGTISVQSEKNGRVQFSGFPEYTLSKESESLLWVAVEELRKETEKQEAPLMIPADFIHKSELEYLEIPDFYEVIPTDPKMLIEIGKILQYDFSSFTNELTILKDGDTLYLSLVDEQKKNYLELIRIYFFRGSGNFYFSEVYGGRELSFEALDRLGTFGQDNITLSSWILSTLFGHQNDKGN